MNKTQWISVVDEMPRERLIVLTFKPMGNGNYHIDIDWRRDGDWCQNSSERPYGSGEISHWMSLPEPPKI